MIIPHFINYPLCSYKYVDFQLFKLGVELLNSKSHLTSNGLMELINIRASLNKGLSDSLK